jgi:hypothetical protein
MIFSKMNSIKNTLLIIGIFTIVSCENLNQGNVDAANQLDPQREFYQLRIYTFDTDAQVEIVDKYLKEAFLPVLKRMKINNVGVFKPRPGQMDTVKKTFVLIPFSALKQFSILDEEFSKDEVYLAAGNEYILASHNEPPYQRLESVLLKAFEHMPVMQTPVFDSPRSDRIYELRSYESPTEAYFRNKVDMFNAGGEIKLFESLKFNAVFYGEVISGPNMPNLMYMTSFSDQASRDAHWKDFVESQEWKEMSSLEKYQDNVSHIDRYFLYPTEYSDY